MKVFVISWVEDSGINNISSIFSEDVTASDILTAIHVWVVTHVDKISLINSVQLIGDA